MCILMLACSTNSLNNCFMHLFSPKYMFFRISNLCDYVTIAICGRKFWEILRDSISKKVVFTASVNFHL